MEGIGLAASIVGLLAAGGKMIPWLFNLKNGLTDAPDSIRTVWTELTETSLILKEIQLYILQVHPTTSNRRSLILIDHISVTLTGCIVTYSDLERQIDFTRASENIDHMSIFERGKWLLKEKEILDIIRRLQNHKNAKWLLVLDNVVEVDKISKLCPRRALNGNVIIITRESSVHRYRNITDQSAGPVLEYELPSLNEADAIALIQASFPYITFDDKVNNACSELIERVGRLPVGIQAIMNLIKEQGGGLQGQEKLSSTAAVLKNCKIRHGYRLESYSDTDPNDLLHKIWAHELERLKLREDAYRDDKVEASTAGASNILDIVAFLDPETITEAHIQSILSYQVMLIQRHKMVPSREANFLEAAGLASLRPLLVNPPDLKARYQIDKLARYSRIIEMPVAKRRGIMDMISGWFLQFRSEEPGTMDQTQDSTVPKAVTSAIAIEFLIDVDPNGESFGLPILFLTALRNGCRVFSNQIQYETIDPVKTWIIARKFLETLALVTDHPNCDQMVLSGDRKDPGEVNLEIVECLFMQAREAMMSGSLQAALELLERCKVYYERYFYLEPDRIGTDQSGTQKSGISGLDLTQMFSRLKSDNLETRSLQDIQYALRGYSKCDIQIITALTRLGKIDVPETASRLSMPHAQYSLGNICLKEEKYDEALCLHKNSLSLFSRMYGEEHYLTAAASAQLGMSCIRQDRYSEGM
ncbi:hypothetical protein Dda_4360 [Drechslerella dactyloides]|uniref:NB-ARC domain-containing protein n=1 Tax=Drechslerella dactyloides TaxID=74499 RepID=A0AAD6NKI5_DREDA|nr:hypothetical protein Dda_4360 [Drechslerella dactyloides]